ncbi:uncharacterized protein H6S33_011719 [Morchella sextelata]|uniref:uncharacterized protein n=1 Tax=Morchella sextelata TaxID=1174677 RepID=UPI001D040E5F|nr:uncharacterized protein H6S33_011719 [Morchella sextelata]KAH0610192.1 hypothetical protein H6S33_011719 [Morchella sextelata]
MQIVIVGATCAVLFFAYRAYQTYLSIRSEQSLKSAKTCVRVPPGPTPAPIIGNILQIPKTHTWIRFKQWADIYGPIYKFQVGSKNNIVVSTEKIANDLLRGRGNIYSSREFLYFATELLSKNLRPLLLPYNDTWRRGRKLMHTLGMPKVVDTFRPAQSLEAKKLLNDMLEDPESYENHFERYAAGIIFRLAFGKAVETGREPYVRDIYNIVHTVERVAAPGAYLCDSIPLLRYIPEFLSPFKREAKWLHNREIKLFRELQNDIRVGIKNGNAPECLTRTFLENEEEFGMTSDESAYVIGTFFEAGSGTTAGAMLTFCLAMCLHPHVQTRGQAEVDAVCGDRMPDFDDLPNLPYARAVMKEILRWRPVLAGGMPHELTKDDEYEGYNFPKGTVVHPNLWAIHRNPEQYPDPETFNPDRWVNPAYPTYKEPLSVYPNLQNFSAFGFGRRICPGMNIAERSLYLLTIRLLWAFQMNKKRDASGNEIDIPYYDYDSGLSSRAKPFQFDCKARSPTRALVIRESWYEAKATDPLRSRD